MSNPRTVPGSLPHLRLAHLLSPCLPRPAETQGGQARGRCDLHKQPWGAGLETCNLKLPEREAGGAESSRPVCLAVGPCLKITTVSHTSEQYNDLRLKTRLTSVR